jgi:hypothetical protein
MELYVFAVSAHGLKQLKIPDSVPVALKRVGRTAIGLDGGDVCEPLRWDKDRLIVRLSFRVEQPEYSRIYSCKITLKLQHHIHTAPTMQLIDVTKPEPET